MGWTECINHIYSSDGVTFAAVSISLRKKTAICQSGKVGSLMLCYERSQQQKSIPEGKAS
ncbi:hypothetical protein BC008_35755 [Mastigocoleus testarum BC008]|uniref:Uncharacterized protein n=1 Tax=Mastigocoleus testarum BC008 TaxID=371196 RepID=A0A0V7ZY34_9CYAN|nr:hypothetical protein BC008_35755 [Mastigocoleus testarum BC008]